MNHRGKIIDSTKKFDVIDCRSCCFKHIMPIPSSKELESIYRHDYYSVEKPFYIQRYKQDLSWWNEVYKERYNKFEKLLRPNQRSILDIGSGPGYFLLHGKKRGWQTTGIEPSREAAQHSRKLGLDIKEIMLDESTSKNLSSYDVIHLSEVLEHLPDPLAMLKLVHRLLTESGIICIAVPNDYNPFQNILRSVCGFKPWWISPPHHINYFDFKTLKKLVIKSGFHVEAIETTFPIDLFLLMGDNYIDNDVLGRQCHQKRIRFEKNLWAAGATEFKQKLYRSFAKLNLGREVVIYGRKKST